MDIGCVVALSVSGVNLIIAGVAYWRAGGREDVGAMREQLQRQIESLRARERALAEELARRLRTSYEDSLARIKRADERLAQLGEEASAEVQRSVDAMRRRLADARREIEASMARLKQEVSTRAEATEQALARRVRRLEGRVQLLMARAEIVRAERLAGNAQFDKATEVLEDAVAKVREVRLRLSDGFEEDPIFDRVIATLQVAIRAVRLQAIDHKRRLDEVLAASDSLLASLEAREQVLV